MTKTPPNSLEAQESMIAIYWGAAGFATQAGLESSAAVVITTINGLHTFIPSECQRFFTCKLSVQGDEMGRTDGFTYCIERLLEVFLGDVHVGGV